MTTAKPELATSHSLDETERDVIAIPKLYDSISSILRKSP